MTPAETKVCADRTAYMRSWHAARRARGLCFLCPAKAPPGKAMCPACYAKRRARERAEAVREHDRETRRRMWQAVDWSRPTAEIAADMDVTESAVRKRRAEAGVRRARIGRPRKEGR